MIETPPVAPWTAAQVRVVAACDVLATFVVAAAAHAASDTAALQDQMSWVSVAILALLVAVVANGALFLAARRAIGRRRLDLIPDAPAPIDPVLPSTGDARWWWLPGAARAHVHTCPMIAGKPAKEISAHQIRAKRLLRCEICG